MTKQAAMTKLRSISRPRRTAFALEPRMLFDGAAAVAVDQFQPEAPAEHDVADAAASGVAAPEVAAQAGSGSSRVLILVDERLAGDPALMAALPGDAMVRVIAAGADGLDVATEALREAAQGGSVDAVHVLSHGSAGQVQLGRSVMDSASLLRQAGPVADWGLALLLSKLAVDTATCLRCQPGVYAIGDIVHYPGKKKLILSGFHEAALAAFGAAPYIFPDKKIHMQYTTTSPKLHKVLGVESPVFD